ncbi:MAG: 2-succinyl-5-enolpyruvyl-6-hydroxy-3-cyclohexene-1-carboxylic-acid synthase [Bacteroidetes bacterium]|nr:2-succinyl-5-enolpyruvyl-6-hydroxy-3-cyclohexene-1-carboxylic-acid synthase [Bacteroidota bacterium]
MQHYANINQLWAQVIADELARCGVRHAVISPGSRNTPVVLALAAHPDITDHSVIDERSAAFFALGLAKATRLPVVLLCTSGTAAANYFPAVCEADASRVPLLLLTADRPGSLRDSGAPQTMDQLKLYGGHVRWFLDACLPEADEVRLRALRSSMCHAFARAAGQPAGPVHVNLPFRKPLEPIPIEREQDRIPDELFTRDPEAAAGRFDGRPWTRVLSSVPREGALEAIADALLSARRPVILAGSDPGGAKHSGELLRIASRHNVPVFAEATSQLRSAPAHAMRISTLDLLLRSSAFRNVFQPDVILQIGGVPTNATVQRFLGHSSADHLCITSDYGRADAAHTVRLQVHDESGDFLTRLSAFLETCPPRPVDADFMRTIGDGDAAVRRLLAERWASSPPQFEGAMMHRLGKLIPAHSAIFVSSSMPIRDFESFALDLPEGSAVYFNRGVNGIDGIISTALGVARERGTPSLLLTGDIAFLHNMNAAAGAGMCDIPLTVLLINNDGGEIFDMLPVRDFDPAYSRHFTTAHGVDFGSVCAAFDVDFRTLASLDELGSALDAAFASQRMSVIEVRTSIKESGSLRRELLRDLADAVDGTLPVRDAALSGRKERFPFAWHTLSAGGGTPVLFLHGFTRASGSWRPLLSHLPETSAIGIDLMGHGTSPQPDPAAHLDVYGLEYAAEELKEIVERLGAGKVHLVGYSLGGRTALHMALRHPELLRSLALISANPGIEDGPERARRKEADAELAMRIGEIGLERFVTEWSEGPLFAAQRALNAHAWMEARRDRSRRQSRGLQGSLIGSGQGAQEPLWEFLPQLGLPVLVAAGASDGRYAEIATRMHALLPHAELHVFENAGHDLLFETPGPLAEALQRLWLR